MNKIANWIKNNQIAAFFLITFAITWGLGFSYRGVLLRSQFLMFPLAVIATCGPALAGIIITTIATSNIRHGTRGEYWKAFFVAWIVSAMVMVANLVFIENVSLSLMLVILITLSVLPVAFVIASAFSRNLSVRRLVASLVQLRGVMGWARLGIALVSGIVLFSPVVSNIFRNQPIRSLYFPGMSLSLIGLIVVKFIYQLFFFNATGEEVGWRGFVLPRLQARTSPLMAALAITLFWVPWHFFLWQAEGVPVLTWQFWLEQYLVTIMFSVIIVWFYNRSKGSILVAGIVHATGNTAVAFIPVGDGQILHLSFLLVVLVMIFIDKMWKKLPADSQAVYQEHALEV